MTRGAASSFTFTASLSPVWSPDGSRIAFVAYTPSTNALYAKTVQGTGRKNCCSNPVECRIGYSAIGRKTGSLLYHQPDPKTGYDLWLLPLSGNRKPIPFLRTEFNERCGAFSPDGKWVAYASDQSGRSEIYVQAFPGEGGRLGKKMAGLLRRRNMAEMEARR